MKICHITIHNYRSIADVDIDVSDMLTLLGPNNHGKSNILRALDFALSAAAKPSPTDFCAFRREDDNELWGELTFASLTEQEKTTFHKYLRTDETVRIRKIASLQGENVNVSYRGYVQEPEEWWLKSSAVERLGNTQQIQHEATEVPPLSEILEGGGRITRQRVLDWQQSYIETHRADLTFSEALEESALLGQRNVAGGVLPDLYLVPAVRDLSDETKTKGTTVFGRLLQRAVREMAERDPRFVDLRTRMQQLVSELNARPAEADQEPSQLAHLESSLAGELSLWGVDVSIEVTPPEIEKLLELGTELHLDDGLRTLAEQKGHGLQRAVIFALLKAWARALRRTSDPEQTEARLASESIYFAFEEPELFLHPHAQRQLADALRELAQTADHQVFVCTHSTHFVDLDQYRGIAIVSKPDARTGTQIRQCVDDLFEGENAQDKKDRFHMASWVNPDRGEMFFADKVILVEGETEKTILPFLADKLDCFNPAISIIDCGSKFNLKLYIAILNAFQIPYFVIHDQDPLPDPIPADWGNDKRQAKQRTFSENSAIRDACDSRFGVVEVNEPDFEAIAGVSRSQGKKMGKPIAALEYFEPKSADEIPERLATQIRAAYSAPSSQESG